METIDKEILEAIVASEFSSSKDETRFQLCGVALSRGSDVGRIEVKACSGHILAVTKFRDCSFLFELLSDKTYLIRSSSIKTIKLALKEHKHLPSVSVEVIGSTSTDIQLKLCGKFLITLEDVKYPHVGQLIPNYDSLDYTIGFDVDLLLNLAKSLPKGGKQRMVALKIKDPLSPILVMSKNQDLEHVGVLMPVRL